MMNKKTLSKILLAVCVLNFAGHLLIFPKLPAMIPTHWNVSNEIDGWSPKYADLLMALLPLGMFILFQVLPKIDPKSASYEKFESIWNGFKAAMVLFMAIISWMGPLTVLGYIREGSSLISIFVSGAIGVIFIVLGNYMPRVRQNYMFGIKTPWTLADEHVWERTHRMGGFVFILMGAVLIVMGVAAPKFGSSSLAVAVLLVTVFAGVIWLFVYSYLVYRGRMR